jgi:hypothetical protein
VLKKGDATVAVRRPAPTAESGGHRRNKRAIPATASAQRSNAAIPGTTYLHPKRIIGVAFSKKDFDPHPLELGKWHSEVS